MSDATATLPSRLLVYLIKPSKYEDDGSVLTFWKGILPSNTLTTLNALVLGWTVSSNATVEVPAATLSAAGATPTPTVTVPQAVAAVAVDTPRSYDVTNEETLTLASGEDFVHALSLPDGRLFAVTVTTPSKVLRFNDPQNDLTDYDVLTFPNSGGDSSFHNSASCLIYSPVTEKLYVTGSLSHTRSLAEDPLSDSLGLSRTRWDLTGMAGYTIKGATVFLSVGRTISQMDAYGSQFAITAGASGGFSGRRVRR